MLGFGAIGQFALGQQTDAFAASVTLVGVAGTGAVGAMSVSGSEISLTLTGVAGTGAAGSIMAASSSVVNLTGVAGTGAVGDIVLYIPLPIDETLKLSNVLRRLRLLGNWTAPRARNMYVGRDFDPANSTESEVYSLDFVNEISTSETLSSVTSTTLTVYQGTDSDPSSHLSGISSITGTVVSQRITGLTSGVTYTLAFTVLTNMSNTITLFSRVACRPVS